MTKQEFYAKWAMKVPDYPETKEMFEDCESAIENGWPKPPPPTTQKVIIGLACDIQDILNVQYLGHGWKVKGKLKHFVSKKGKDFMIAVIEKQIRP